MEKKALHVLAGPKCEPQGEWVTDFDNSDDLRSIHGSDDDVKHKKGSQYVAEEIFKNHIWKWGWSLLLLMN